MTDQPKKPTRNYLGQHNVTSVCGACDGTGKSKSLGGARPLDRRCKLCNGTGVLVPGQLPGQGKPDADA